MELPSPPLGEGSDPTPRVDCRPGPVPVLRASWSASRGQQGQAGGQTGTGMLAAKEGNQRTFRGGAGQLSVEPVVPGLGLMALYPSGRQQLGHIGPLLGPALVLRQGPPTQTGHGPGTAPGEAQPWGGTAPGEAQPSLGAAAPPWKGGRTASSRTSGAWPRAPREDQGCCS